MSTLLTGSNTASFDGAARSEALMIVLTSSLSIGKVSFASTCAPRRRLKVRCRSSSISSESSVARTFPAQPETPKTSRGPGRQALNARKHRYVDGVRFRHAERHREPGVAPDGKDRRHIARDQPGDAVLVVVAGADIRVGDVQKRQVLYDEVAIIVLDGHRQLRRLISRAARASAAYARQCRFPGS